MSKLKEKVRSAKAGRRGKGHDDVKSSSRSQSRKKEDRVWDETADVKNLDYSVRSNGNNVKTVDLKDVSKMEEDDDSDVDIPDEVDSFYFEKSYVFEGGSREEWKNEFWNALFVFAWNFGQRHGKQCTQTRRHSTSIGHHEKKAYGKKRGSRHCRKVILSVFVLHFKHNDRLCDSVALNLEGRKLESFRGVSSLVVSAFAEALERVLTPKRSIDILGEIEKSKSRTKPYVIVFVGVNGVGKSTNLAKIAYWLLQNKNKVFLSQKSIKIIDFRS